MSTVPAAALKQDRKQEIDDDVEDEAIPKKKTAGLEAFQDYIDKNKALNQYGTYSVKSCYDILSDPKYDGKTHTSLVIIYLTTLNK
jgi:hypothetical protein